MSAVWIIDTKVSIAPKSSFETDGGDHYFEGPIVPAGNSDQAIASLRAAIAKDQIEIIEIRGVTDSASKNWKPELDVFLILDIASKSLPPPESFNSRCLLPILN